MGPLVLDEAAGDADAFFIVVVVIFGTFIPDQNIEKDMWTVFFRENLGSVGKIHLLYRLNLIL